MVTGDQGRQLIMNAEGLRLEAYLCPAGVWTIGVGHTGDVKEGDKITRHQAETILEYDLQRFEQAVTKAAPRATGPQFDAMVSLAFNIGIAAFEKSGLLKAHLAGQHRNAAIEFGRWVHGGGKILPGLVKRRAAEAALYLTVPS